MIRLYLILVTFAFSHTFAWAGPSLQQTFLFRNIPRTLGLFVDNGAPVLTSKSHFVFICSKTDSADVGSLDRNYLCSFHTDGKFISVRQLPFKINTIIALTDGSVAGLYLEPTLPERRIGHEEFHHKVAILNPQGSQVTPFEAGVEENDPTVAFFRSTALTDGRLLILTDEGKGYFIDATARRLNVINPDVNKFYKFNYAQPKVTRSGKLVLADQTKKQISFYNNSGELLNSIVVESPVTHITPLGDNRVLVDGENGYSLVSEDGRILTTGVAWRYFSGGVFEFTDGSLALNYHSFIRFLNPDGTLKAEFQKRPSGNRDSLEHNPDDFVSIGNNQFLYAYSAQDVLRNKLSYFMYTFDTNGKPSLVYQTEVAIPRMSSFYLGNGRVLSNDSKAYLQAIEPHFSDPGRIPTRLVIVSKEGSEVVVPAVNGTSPFMSFEDLPALKLIRAISNSGVHLIRYDGTIVQTVWQSQNDAGQPAPPLYELVRNWYDDYKPVVLSTKHFVVKNDMRSAIVFVRD